MHLEIVEHLVPGASADHAECVRHARGSQVVGWSYASAVAFLIYDVLITFGDEVRFIWPLPWTFTKALYFFIRYFPILLEMSTQFYGTPLLSYPPEACYVWNVYQGVAVLLLIVSVDYILILRVYGMYPRNRPVKYILTSLYLAEIVTMAVGIYLASPRFQFDIHCVVTKAPPIFLMTVGVPIVYQTLLFLVTIYKFAEAAKKGWGHIPVVQLLLRDGTWAFIVIFAVIIGQALVYGVGPQAYTGFLYGWMNTTWSICGYRLIHNVYALKQPPDPPDGDFETGTNVQFVSDICTDIIGSRATTDSQQPSTYQDGDRDKSRC